MRPVEVFTSPLSFTWPTDLSSQRKSSASPSNSTTCLPKGSFSVSVPVNIPSSLESFKKNGVKSLMFTFFSFAITSVLLVTLSIAVEIIISWLSCLKVTLLASINELRMVNSPSFSRFHFLSLMINEEGKKCILTPSVRVCTLAFNFASLKVLLADVVSCMLEMSLYELMMSLLSGRCMLSLSTISLTVTVSNKVSRLPLLLTDTSWNNFPS